MPLHVSSERKNALNRVEENFKNKDDDAYLEFLRIGLQLVETGVAISEEAVDEWFEGPEDIPFPESDVFTGARLRSFEQLQEAVEDAQSGYGHSS